MIKRGNFVIIYVLIVCIVTTLVAGSYDRSDPLENWDIAYRHHLAFYMYRGDNIDTCVAENIANIFSDAGIGSGHSIDAYLFSSSADDYSAAPSSYISPQKILDHYFYHTTTGEYYYRLAFFFMVKEQMTIDFRLVERDKQSGILQSVDWAEYLAVMQNSGLSDEEKRTELSALFLDDDNTVMRFDNTIDQWQEYEFIPRKIYFFVFSQSDCHDAGSLDVEPEFKVVSNGQTDYAPLGYLFSSYDYGLFMRQNAINFVSVFDLFSDLQTYDLYNDFVSSDASQEDCESVNLDWLTDDEMIWETPNFYISTNRCCEPDDQNIFNGNYICNGGWQPFIDLPEGNDISYCRTQAPQTGFWDSLVDDGISYTYSALSGNDGCCGDDNIAHHDFVSNGDFLIQNPSEQDEPFHWDFDRDDGGNPVYFPEGDFIRLFPGQTNPAQSFIINHAFAPFVNPGEEITVEVDVKENTLQSETDNINIRVYWYYRQGNSWQVDGANFYNNFVIGPGDTGIISHNIIVPEGRERAGVWVYAGGENNPSSTDYVDIDRISIYRTDLYESPSWGVDYGYIKAGNNVLCYQCSNPSGCNYITPSLTSNLKWGWLSADQNSFKIITLE